MKVLVRNEGKSELGATPEDTSRTTFPESPEALLSIWTARAGEWENQVSAWRRRGYEEGTSEADVMIYFGLTNFAKSVQGSLVIRLTLPGFGLETCLHDILGASLVSFTNA